MPHIAEATLPPITTGGVATISEACEFLRLGRTSVYHLMDAGELAYCRFGRARRIPWPELRRFVQQNTSGGSQADLL